MDLPALWLTLRLALCTTVLLLFIALPLAWWFASGDSAVRALLQTFVALPLVLPPTVLGYYLLVLLGPLTWPGRMLIRLLGHPLAFSFSGLLVGSLLYSLPFAVQPLIAGFRSIPAELRETAYTLGATPLRVFRTVTLPLATPSIVASTVLSFTHTIGEFGVVLMMGGNIPGATRTLSIALYDQVQEFNYAAANGTAAFLLLFSVVTIVPIYLVRNRASRSPLA